MTPNVNSRYRASLNRGCAVSGYLPVAVPSSHNKIAVACIDVAAGADLAAAIVFVEKGPQVIVNGRPQQPWSTIRSVYTYSNEGVRVQFIKDVRSYLKAGGLVALGFEAPLWGTWEAVPNPAGRLPKMVGRKHSNNQNIDAPNRSWFANAVAAEVGPLAVELVKALGLKDKVTDDESKWGLKVPMLVWEAYITDQRCCTSKNVVAEPSQRLSQHRQDAYCGVVHGFLNLRPGYPQAATTTRGIAKSTEIPTLAWALSANGLIQPGAIDRPIVIRPGCAEAEQLWP